MEGSKFPSLDWRGFRMDLVRNRHRGRKHEERGSHGGIRRHIAGAHGAVITGLLSCRAAEIPVPVKIPRLTMVQRAVIGSAAGGQG
ncbi:MAG: hypothetical protein LAO19_05470 [Acidobacteriia bacterium]|nr:hypothetical protein [Terriglobia bacterium]